MCTVYFLWWHRGENQFSTIATAKVHMDIYCFSLDFFTLGSRGHEVTFKTPEARGRLINWKWSSIWNKRKSHKWWKQEWHKSQIWNKHKTWQQETKKPTAAKALKPYSITQMSYIFPNSFTNKICKVGHLYPPRSRFYQTFFMIFSSADYW